ncbi:histone acetyltransferase 1 [Microbotryomycetes sp. JL221]|nr:histone acetyltransferase 1 [Microbotryomycetes sp. JL221]
MDTTWSSDATEALKLRFVRSDHDEAELSPDEQVLVRDFEPAFVYPIFGQEETIFGYHDLEIQLRFASGSLNQFLQIKYKDKFPETSTVKPDDPEKILFEFIPPSYLKDWQQFKQRVERDAKEFKPFGQRIGAFREISEDDDVESHGQINGKGKGKARKTETTTLPPRRWQLIDVDRDNIESNNDNDDDDDDQEVVFEAYWSNWDTPGFKEYHRKMQIFVLLYIEGAQYIDEEDPRWEFVTLYERRKRRDGDGFSWHFAGYVSFYSFFCWPDTKRLRLAQFVLTGPYQSQGFGSALYTICYENVLKRPEISELTVEDPSEPFEDMRDKCDLYTLIKAKALEGVTAPFDKTKLEQIRKQFKLADLLTYVRNFFEYKQRQFYRLVEMILLLNLDQTNEQSLKDFRLTVKKRLYMFNKEMMGQLDEQEKKDKLQETFDNVVEGYKRVSEKFVA